MENNWPYKPNIIQIETVQGCNRRCTFCGTMGMKREFHFAERKTIIHACKLIKKAKLNSRILLACHGEPTLHPHIVGIVKDIRRILPNNMIHLFTNGTIIEKKELLVPALFEAGLNDLIFDEYSDHRVGEFVRKSHVCNMFDIVEQGAGVPLFASKKLNEQRICIVPPIDGEGNTISRKIINHCGAGGKGLDKPSSKKCSVIFRDFMVRWDGNVAICCNDFRGEYFVTNIMQHNDLKDVYFHPRLESARKYLMLGQRKDIHPCDICNTTPIRVGLLPDSAGKFTLKKPNEIDRTIVSKVYKPLASIEKRAWEK